MPTSLCQCRAPWPPACYWLLHCWQPLACSLLRAPARCSRRRLRPSPQSSSRCTPTRGLVRPAPSRVARSPHAGPLWAGLRLAGTVQPDSPCMVMPSVSSVTARALVRQRAVAARLTPHVLLRVPPAARPPHSRSVYVTLSELGFVPACSSKPDPAAAAVRHRRSGACAPPHAALPLLRIASCIGCCSGSSPPVMHRPLLCQGSPGECTGPGACACHSSAPWLLLP